MPKISIQWGLSARRINLKNKTIPSPYQSLKPLRIEFRTYLSDVFNSNSSIEYPYTLALLMVFDNQTKNGFKVSRD